MSDIVEKKSAFVSYDGNDEKIKMISDAVNNLTEDVRHESVTFDESPRSYRVRNGDINFSLAENGGVTRPTLYLEQVEYTDMEAYEETHENPFPVHALGDDIYFVDGYSDHDLNDFYQRTAVSFPLNGLSAGSLYTISFDMTASWPYKITDCLRSDPDNPRRFGIVIHDSPNIDESYTEEGYHEPYHGFHRVVVSNNYVENEIYDSYYPSLQYYSFPRDWNQISTKHVEFQFIAYENTYITYILDGFLTKAELIDAHGESWYDQNVKGNRLIEFHNFSISNYSSWTPLTIKQLYAYSEDNLSWAALDTTESKLFGLSAPSSSIGKNGDYYLQYSVEEISNFTVTANSSYGFVSDTIWKDSTGYNMSASSSENPVNIPAYIEYSISNLIAYESYIFTYAVFKSESGRHDSGSIGIYSSLGPYDRTEDTGDVEKSIVAYGTSIALRLETDFDYDYDATVSTVINGLKGYKCSLQDIWYKVEGSWYKYKGPGGGSGSNVTITPSLLSGTPIASYTIGENTSGTLYAPTPTTVDANPASQATDNLNTLLVDQTTYTVPAVYSGTTQPVSSKENDIFAKTLVSIPYMHPDSSGVVTSETTDYANNEISIYGSVTDEFKDIYTYIVDNLIVGNTYTFSCSFQQDGDATKVWPDANDRNCISICYPYLTSSADIGISETANTVSTLTDGTAITLYNDTNAHDYTFTFEANNTTMYLQLFLTKYKNGPQYGGVNRNIEWLDISITGVGSEIDGLYFNKGGNYQLIDGVKKVIPKTSQGDILATIVNYDGSTTDIHGSTGGGGSSVVPNPSGVATDTLEKVGINGTVYDLKDVSALHPEDVNATYEWTRPTAQNSIVTDIVPNITDRIEMQYIYDEINGSWGLGLTPSIFYAAPKYYYRYYNTNGYELSVGNSGSWTIWGENMIKTPGHIVTLKYNEDFTSHTVYIYDETAQTEMKSQQAMNYSVACTGTLVFFNDAQSGSNTTYSKLKYFKIWDVTTKELKHHFIPIADGLYDMVTDRSYQYTNNNYEHGNVTGYLDFTSIKPNPTDTPTDILETIKIDDTTYSLGIVANPSGSATDSLTKLQVGETIYNVAGGGGGGGSNSLTKIWDYVDDNSGSVLFGTFTKTLHDDINNYDKIIMEVMSSSSDSGNWDATEFFEFSVTAINASKNPGRVTINTYDTRSSSYYIHETTLQKIADNGSNVNGLVRVYGVKSGGGSGGGYSETTLFTGDYTTTSGEITLSDDLDNYDQIVIWAIWSNSSLGGSTPYFIDRAHFVSSCPYDSGSTAVSTKHIVISPYSTQYIRVKCGSANNKLLIYDSVDIAIGKVTGINYGGGGGSDQSYTTYERQIGTWIDGKPLYQVTQVYDKTTITSTSMAFAHNISNIDQICGMECLYSFTGYQPSEKYMAILPWCYNEGSSSVNVYYGGYRIGKDKIFVQIGNSLYSDTSEWTFTFKYTKTTDT